MFSAVGKKTFKQFLTVNKYKSNEQIQQIQQIWSMQKRNYAGWTEIIIFGQLALTISPFIIGAYVKDKYIVAQSHQYIVKTGPFIEGINVSKQTLILPFQLYNFVNMNPLTIETIVLAMTTEKIPFNMPMKITIVIKEDFESIRKYATHYNDISNYELEKSILGIIHGAIRILVATLELEALFNDKNKFKNKITDEINLILDNFGLKAININLEELVDSEDSKYFQHMKTKALERALNKARVDAAEQTKEGDIGELHFKAESRKKSAEITSNTIEIENNRQQEIIKSMTRLEIEKAENEKYRKIAVAISKAESEMKEIDLQREVEDKRKEQEISKLRAKDLAAADVRAQVKKSDTEGIMNSEKIKIEIEAQIAIIKAKTDLEKQRLDADSIFYIEQKKAEALVITKKAEADGIKMIKEAEANGLQLLVNAVNGNINNLNTYLLVNSGKVVDLATANALAVKDMKPSIWITGNQNDKLSNVVEDLTKSIFPLSSAIEAQTGFKLIESLNIKKKE